MGSWYYHFGNSSPSSQPIWADDPCVARLPNLGKGLVSAETLLVLQLLQQGLRRIWPPSAQRGWIFWLLGSAGKFGLFSITWDWGTSGTVVRRMKTKVGSQWNDIVQCGRYCSAQTKDVWTYRVWTRKISRRNYCQRDDSWNCGRGSWKCMEQESHLLQALYKYMLSVAFAFPDRNGDWPWVPDEMHVSSSFTIFYNLVQVLQVSARVQDCSMDFKTWKFLVLRGPSADSHRSLLTLERLKQGTAVQREKLWSLVPLAAVMLMPLLARCRACSFDRMNRLFEPVLSQDFLDGSEEELVLWPCESRMPCDDYSAAVTWTQLSQFSISTSLVLPVPCSTCRSLIGWRNALKPFQNKPTLQDLQDQ